MVGKVKKTATKVKMSRTLKTRTTGKAVSKKIAPTLANSVVATQVAPAKKKVSVAKKKDSGGDEIMKSQATMDPSLHRGTQTMEQEQQPNTSLKNQNSSPTVRTAASLDQEVDSSIKGTYQETVGEAYMNHRQQAYFRRILFQWRQQLSDDMNRTVHHLQDEATVLPDLIDRATQEEEFSLELHTRNREHKLIKKIEETLEKLDEGRYGYCEVCNVEIGIRRLEARPTASLCIDCKTLDEIREKQSSY